MTLGLEARPTYASVAILLCLCGKGSFILGFLVLVIVAGVARLFLRKPAMTPERIARGQYLYEAVADCGGCHLQRDFTRVGGPEVFTGRGRGVIRPASCRACPV